MGFVRSCANFTCFRMFPALLLLLAVLIGYLKTYEIPSAAAGAIIVCAAKGIPPPLLFGHGKMAGPPHVPSDVKPMGFPPGEMSLSLPGDYKTEISFPCDHFSHVYRMPQIGLGMCCRPTAYDDVMVERTVLWYLMLGGRLIDTAQLYGNHRAIGAALREAVRRGVNRSDIFVTTKVWGSSFGRSNPKKAVEQFLEQLGLSYLDLVLLHQPYPILPSFIESNECADEGWTHAECRANSWRSLSEAREQGLVRSIGVSNFNGEQLDELASLRGTAPVAVNQIQFHPWVPLKWSRVYEHCRQKGIAVTAYYSLGGIFRKEAAVGVDQVKAFASAHDATPAQVLFRWALQKGVAIIPGTSSPEHMRENLSLYHKFELTPTEMRALDSLRAEETDKLFSIWSMM